MFLSHVFLFFSFILIYKCKENWLKTAGFHNHIKPQLLQNKRRVKTLWQSPLHTRSHTDTQRQLKRDKFSLWNPQRELTHTQGEHTRRKSLGSDLSPGSPDFKVTVLNRCTNVQPYTKTFLVSVWGWLHCSDTKCDMYSSILTTLIRSLLYKFNSLSWQNKIKLWTRFYT